MPHLLFYSISPSSLQDPRSATSTLVSSQMPQDEQTRWLNDALAGVKRSAFFMGKAMVRRAFFFFNGIDGVALLLLFRRTEKRARVSIAIQ